MLLCFSVTSIQSGGNGSQFNPPRLVFLADTSQVEMHHVQSWPTFSTLSYRGPLKRCQNMFPGSYIDDVLTWFSAWFPMFCHVFLSISSQEQQVFNSFPSLSPLRLVEAVSDHWGSLDNPNMPPEDAENIQVRSEMSLRRWWMIEWDYNIQYIDIYWGYIYIIYNYIHIQLYIYTYMCIYDYIYNHDRLHRICPISTLRVWTGKKNLEYLG